MSFLNAIQTKAQAIDTSLRAPVTVSPPKPNNIPPVIVEIDDTHRRIDIFFASKPNDDILNQLRFNGWRFRPSDKAWYHFDSEEHRLFVEINFGVKDSSPMPEKRPTEPAKALIPEAGPSEPYSKYKQQINELLAELKLDAADLQLLAIDTLHKKIFV